MFGGNFAPAGWMLCQGQLVAISEYETLFNLIGTTYGGDGQDTFALPDLSGRLPVHQGTGPGLSNRILGEKAGVESVTLSVTQLPSHSHALLASSDVPVGASPAGNVTGQAAAKLYRPGTPALALNAASVSSVGGSQPHTNLQPYLCVSFIISLYGIYPSS